MRRLPALLLAVSLAAGMIPAAGAAAASVDPDTPTSEISLFRARTAAGPEFIRVPVKNNDPARIEGCLLYTSRCV